MKHDGHLLLKNNSKCFIIKLMLQKEVVDTFKKGIITGFGWSIGATIGFAIISTVLILILKSLGGLPIFGSFIATIVESTNQELLRRSPILPY